MEKAETGAGDDVAPMAHQATGGIPEVPRASKLGHLQAGVAHSQRHARQHALPGRCGSGDQQFALRAQDIVVDHHHVDVGHGYRVLNHFRVEAVDADRADETPRLQALQRSAQVVREFRDRRSVQLQQRQDRKA